MPLTLQVNSIKGREVTADDAFQELEKADPDLKAAIRQLGLQPKLLVRAFASSLHMLACLHASMHFVSARNFQHHTCMHACFNTFSDAP